MEVRPNPALLERRLRPDELPTYEAATARDPLPLIAKYIYPQDLHRVALVSRRWRHAVQDTLWEQPDRLWEIGARSALISFQLFLRTLSQLSPTSPALPTRALSLLSVQPSLYTVLQPNWLYILLKKLPHLQTLSIPTFSYINHDSLSYLSAHSAAPHASLHTLSLTGCTNATSAGLVALLERLPQLENLDLSATSGAGSRGTVTAISKMHKLETLRLRDLGMTTEMLQIALRGLGTHLWRLDVTGNPLSESIISELLDWNFAPPEYLESPSSSHQPPQQPPPQFPGKQTRGPMNKGISHIHLSAAKITAEAIGKLVRTTRIETLDIGDFKHGDELIPLLSLYAFQKLQYLRIGHQLVTSSDSLKPESLPALKTLVLCDVPPLNRSSKIPNGIIGLLRKLAATPTALLILELEIWEQESDEDGGYPSDSDHDGENLEDNEGFSFFSGGQEEGGSVWVSPDSVVSGRAMQVMDVVRAIAEFRKSSKAEGRAWWDGNVRVVRDLGGKESREMGFEGEPWGLVREKV